MHGSDDLWYIRLPDGRVVRAKSTASVRHHLEVGRIPRDCRVRRSGEYDWLTLEWTPEFADLQRAPSRSEKAAVDGADKPASGDQEQELQNVGVRGFVEDLLAALDSTLHRVKLLVVGLAILVGASLVILAAFPWHLDWPWSLAPWLGSAVGALGLAATVIALLTQMTVVELSRFRPARRSEATALLGRHSLRLIVLHGLVSGSLLLAFYAARRWGAAELWPGSMEGIPTAEVLASLFTILSLVLQVLLWPLLGFTLLFGPVVIVEECSIWRALVLWRAFVRDHLPRLFLYEALVFALGAAISLPLLFPVLVAGWNSTPGGGVRDATLAVLTALALTPLLAFEIVANAFIYLNLRYDFTPSKQVG